MSTILGYVSDFVETMLDVGTDLVSWITTPANSIALIGIVMFLLVAFVGAIRKLIKGI